jgi:hypothetical protein
MINLDLIPYFVLRIAISSATLLPRALITVSARHWEAASVTNIILDQ